MGRPRAEGIRIYGPYKRGDIWRIHVVYPADVEGRRKTVYRRYSTRAQAEEWIDGAQDQAQGRTVGDAVTAWLTAKRAAGRPDRTIETYRGMLALMLGEVMRRPVRHLIGRGDELYLRAQTYPRGHRMAGKRRAADTHRNSLGRARELGRWLVKHRWLARNPFADVEAVGQRVVGADKIRLTADESRMLDAWCIDNAADIRAVLAKAYIELGVRASELCNRNVRDLDDNGTVIRIVKTKTESGRRSLRLPPGLSDMLRAMVAGLPADAPIFTNQRGKRLSRHMARLLVRDACKAAGVTVVSPQALRRTSATIGAEINETPLAISQFLGHSSGKAASVTGRSYVGRDAAAQAKVERAVRVLKAV